MIICNATFVVFTVGALTIPVYYSSRKVIYCAVGVLCSNRMYPDESCSESCEEGTYCKNTLFASFMLLYSHYFAFFTFLHVFPIAKHSRILAKRIPATTLIRYHILLPLPNSIFLVVLTVSMHRSTENGCTCR